MSRKTHPATIYTVDVRPRRRRLPAGWQAGIDKGHAEDPIPALTVVRRVAKTVLTPGTVVWAHVPYEETDGWKLRPAVVSQISGREIIVFPGTTADGRFRYPRAYRELVDLEAAGLRRATGVELSPITIDVIDVVSVAGGLAADDHAALFGAGVVDVTGRAAA